MTPEEMMAKFGRLMESMGARMPDDAQINGMHTGYDPATGTTKYEWQAKASGTNRPRDTAFWDPGALPGKEEGRRKKEEYEWQAKASGTNRPRDTAFWDPGALPGKEEGRRKKEETESPRSTQSRPIGKTDRGNRYHYEVMSGGDCIAVLPWTPEDWKRPEAFGRR